MGVILLLLIAQGLFFRTTQISTFHPLVYQYIRNDTDFVVTEDGYILKLTWKNKGNALRFNLIDSSYTGIKNITFAKFEGNSLWLSDNHSTYLYKDSLKKVLNNVIIDVSQNGNTSYLLTRQGLYIINTGFIRKIAKPLISNEKFTSHLIPLPTHKVRGGRIGGENFRTSSTITGISKFLNLRVSYFIPLKDSVIFASGRGELWKISPSHEELLYKSPNFSITNWKRERKDFPFLKLHFWSRGNNGTLLFLGYNSQMDSSKLVYVKSDKNLKTIKYPGLIAHILYSNGNFWIFTVDSQKTSLRIIRESDFSLVDSFRYELLPTAVLKIYKDYWMIFIWGGPTFLFKENHINKPYNFWPWNYRMFSDPLQKDLDGDGDLDLILIGTSIWSAPAESRAWAIVAFENQIPEYIQRALTLYKKAIDHNNYIESNKGLLEIDLSLETFNVLLPESLPSFLKLRGEIYHKLVIRNKFIRFFKIFIRILLLVFLPIGVVLLFYARYKMAKDPYKPIPSAYTISMLLSLDIFHKFSSKWYPLLSNPENLKGRLEDFHEEISNILNILNNPKIKYEFKEAPKKWRKFYRSLHSNLTQLEIVLYLYRKFPSLAKFCEKFFRSRVKNIGELRKQFKEMSESAKVEVITGAMLPAIEEIQKKIADKPIKIKTDIKTELPYFYYPDEILELKSAFLIILDNAVESFENFTPRGEPHIIVRVRSSVSELKIEIEDNGKGIPLSILPKIFEEGFSYGKRGEGRGTGLAVAKRIIEKFGVIDVFSKPGEGTKFLIRLIFGKREVQDDTGLR